MSEQWIHVVAAVIENEQGKILIAKRPSNKHQGGLWEFPGGKVEQGEDVFYALKRELNEELGIEIHSSQSYLQIRHQYPDKAIFLDIYKVINFSGRAEGKEGQEVRWIDVSEVKNYEFPKANTKIVKTLKAPELLSICSADIDAAFFSSEKLNEKVEALSKLNIDSLLLRLPLLNDAEYITTFFIIHKKLSSSSQNKKIKLLINRPHLIKELSFCAGLHLSAKELLQMQSRSIDAPLSLSASCHNIAELKHAEKIGCDFVLLSPVLNTDSHPEVEPLTWKGLKALLETIEVPVLALGGMRIHYLEEAKQQGAFGVAGISNFGMLAT